MANMQQVETMISFFFFRFVIVTSCCRNWNFLINARAFNQFGMFAILISHKITRYCGNQFMTKFPISFPIIPYSEYRARTHWNCSVFAKLVQWKEKWVIHSSCCVLELLRWFEQNSQADRKIVSYLCGVNVLCVRQFTTSTQLVSCAQWHNILL